MVGTLVEVTAQSWVWKMILRRASFIILVVAAGLCVRAGLPVPTLALNSGIEKLASRTAQELIKKKFAIVLIAPEEGCTLAPPDLRHV